MVDRAALEMQCTARYRGFESLSLRQVVIAQEPGTPVLVDMSPNLMRDENLGSVSHQANRQSFRIGAKP